MIPYRMFSSKSSLCAKEQEKPCLPLYCGFVVLSVEASYKI